MPAELAARMMVGTLAPSPAAAPLAAASSSAAPRGVVVVACVASAAALQSPICGSTAGSVAPVAGCGFGAVSGQSRGLGGPSSALDAVVGEADNWCTAILGHSEAGDTPLEEGAETCAGADRSRVNVAVAERALAESGDATPEPRGTSSAWHGDSGTPRRALLAKGDMMRHRGMRHRGML